MKIKTTLGIIIMAVVMLPTMMSCSGSDSKSPFGSLPKVYGEYLEAGNKLKEEAKNIKTDEDKAKYIEKSEKLKEKWTEKIANAAKKLDGKPIEIGEGEFAVTEPISFQFEDMVHKALLHAVFNFNGTAVTSDDTVLERSYYAKTASVKLVGYDAEGQEMFRSNVGAIDVEERDGKSFIPKGTPVKFNSFQFGGDNMDKYSNTEILKLEVIKADR